MESPEYQCLLKAVAWKDRSNHGIVHPWCWWVSIYPASVPNQCIRPGWSFFVNCVARRSGMLHELLAAATTPYNSPYRYSSQCKIGWKPDCRVTDRLTDLPGPVHTLHPCLLSNRFWSNTLCERQKMRPIPSAAPDRFSPGTGSRHR